MPESIGATQRLLDAFRTAAEEVSTTGCVPYLTLDTPLTALALDSVQLAELSCALEERLGRRTSPERYFGAQTIGDVLAVLGCEPLSSEPLAARRLA